VARKSSVTVFAVLMTAAIPAVAIGDARLSIALVSVAMMGSTAVTANMLAMPADVFPKNAVASVWGLSGLGTGCGGMVFALLTGWLVDHYSYLPVFIMFGLQPLIATLILWFILGPLRPAFEGTSR
jgi:ACS family hexuronate transporter-like MFS transporter